MCLAIPMQIISLLDNGMARVSVMGTERNVALDLTPEAKTDDFVLVHAGFAIQIVSEQYALETLSLIQKMAEMDMISDRDEIDMLDELARNTKKQKTPKASVQ